MTLTAAQRAVLAAACTQPTLPAISETVGTGKPTVHKHLTALRALGLVDWCDGRRGTLHVAHGVVAVGGEPYMAEPV